MFLRTSAAVYLDQFTGAIDYLSQDDAGGDAPQLVRDFEAPLGGLQTETKVYTLHCYRVRITLN